MIYTNNVLIPANTPAISPVCERIQINLGLVYKVELQFPPGCAGLVHIVINDGGYQVWPSTPNTDFATDDYTVSFEDTYLKKADPADLQIYGYNLDETYQHIIQIRLGVASQEVFMARYMPTLAYDYFIALMEKKEAKAEAERKAVEPKPFSYFFQGVK